MFFAPRLQRPARASKRHRFRPNLDGLEDRMVLSTLTVTNIADTGVAGDGSLRGEIAAAGSGDTIVFDPSLSGQTIDLFGINADGELVINKNLTIQGPGAPLSPVAIEGATSRVFEVDGARTVVSLSNLNLIDGTGVALNSASAGAVNGQGGAIWNGGTLTLSACSFSQNDAGIGGALYNAGTMTLSACNVSNNTAINGGGPGLGGAIYNAGTLTVNSSTLDNNTVYHQTFDNTYGGNGGAIYNAGTLTVSNSTLDDNTARMGQFGGGEGGGIFNAYRATATITGSSLSGNFAWAGQTFTGVLYGGGGLYNSGGMTVSGSTISGNSVDGIFNDKKGHLALTSKSSVDVLVNFGAVKTSNDSTVGVIRT